MARTNPSNQQLTRVTRFLKQQRWWSSYRYIVYGKILFTARVKLIEDALDPMKTAMIQPVNTADPHLQDWVSVVHARQLDLLSKIFMLYEDFFAYSHALRVNPGDLASALASRRSYASEADFLEKAGKREIRAYYRISDPAALASKADRDFVRRMVDTAVGEMQSRAKRVARFWRLYYPVYLAYKHKFSAVIGLYQIEPAHNILSRIYLRHEEGRRIRTHVIPCDLGTITYYEDVVMDLVSLFDSLLDNFQLYVNNCGGPFFPTLPIPSIAPQDAQRLQKIIDSMNYVQTKVGINLMIRWNPRRGKVAYHAMQKRFIYSTSKDMLAGGRGKLRAKM